MEANIIVNLKFTYYIISAMEAHIIVNKKFTNCWQDWLGYPGSIMMQKLDENCLTKSLFSGLFRKHLISIICQLILNN